MGTSEFSRYLVNFHGQPAVSESVLSRYKELIGRLPKDYVEFLRIADGGEGFIGQSVYVIFWRLEEILPFNRAYEVQSYAPDLLLFGSNGGGEAFAFDTRRSPWTIGMVPFVGMDRELFETAASDFLTFLDVLYHIEEDGGGQLEGRMGSAYAAKEIFEITPVILGGDPVDPANKTVLDRQNHIQVVNYWNNLIRELKEKGGLEEE